MLPHTANKTSHSKLKTLADTSTKVNYFDYVKTTYYSGKRDTIGFAGDLGLYARFKPVSKEMYGSTCRAFECFMASTIAAYDNKVNFSLGSNPLKIDQHIVIERNIRPRRKMVVDMPTGDGVEMKVQRVGKCCIPACAEKGIPLSSPAGEVRYFCEFHIGAPMRQNWKGVEV